MLAEWWRYLHTSPRPFPRITQDEVTAEWRTDFCLWMASGIATHIQNHSTRAGLMLCPYASTLSANWPIKFGLNMHSRPLQQAHPPPLAKQTKSPFGTSPETPSLPLISFCHCHRLRRAVVPSKTWKKRGAAKPNAPLWVRREDVDSTHHSLMGGWSAVL